MIRLIVELFLVAIFSAFVAAKYSFCTRISWMGSRLIAGVRPSNNNPFTPSLVRAKRPCSPIHSQDTSVGSTIYAASPNKVREHHFVFLLPSLIAATFNACFFVRFTIAISCWAYIRRFLGLSWRMFDKRVLVAAAPAATRCTYFGRTQSWIKQYFKVSSGVWDHLSARRRWIWHRP